VQCMRKSTACAQQVHSPSIAPADAELGECARAGTAWALHEECECSACGRALRVHSRCTAPAVPRPRRARGVRTRGRCMSAVQAWHRLILTPDRCGPLVDSTRASDTSQPFSRRDEPCHSATTTNQCSSAELGVTRRYSAASGYSAFAFQPLPTTEAIVPNCRVRPWSSLSYMEEARG
jgi:hypothetical protein